MLKEKFFFDLMIIFILGSFSALNALRSSVLKSYALDLKSTVELYDSLNSLRILANIRDELVFIDKNISSFPMALTEFDLVGNELSMNGKYICDKGKIQTSLGLYLKELNPGNRWFFEEEPGKSGIYRIKNTSGTRCAIYGNLSTGKGVIYHGLCTDPNVVEFKASPSNDLAKLELDKAVNDISDRRLLGLKSPLDSDGLRNPFKRV